LFNYEILSEQTDSVVHCREDKEVETAPSAAASPLIPTDGQQVPRLPFDHKEVHAIPSSDFFFNNTAYLKMAGFIMCAS
jgi:hypothetical protein